jgi:diguanylate cyclase (GGDEF)-like protein
MLLFDVVKATFSAPKYIPKNDRATFYALMLGAWTGLFLHIAMFGIFYWQDVTLLAQINIASILAWLAVLYLFYKGDLVNGLYLTSFEIIVHAIFAASVLGTDYGLHFYLISVACMLSIDPKLSKRSGLYMSVFCLVVFVSMYFLYPKRTEVIFFDEYIDYIFIGGFITALLPVVLGIYQMKKEYLRQRETLEKVANFDMLTGLHNRRFFYDFLDVQQALIKKQQSSFCIALADIDHFKLINDSHGHDVGDDVLVEVSSLLTACLTKNDSVCRWGGEEFMIFLPAENIDSAKQQITSVIEKMMSKKFTRKQLKTSMSFGLVEVYPDEKIDDFVKRADKLLYSAKHNGRNRVETEIAQT